VTRAPARYVVPSERHVERVALAGHAAETRTRLRLRLLEALAPDVVLASRLEARLALAGALARIAPADPLLAPLARDGGAAWTRTVDAIDRAIGALRSAGTRLETLATVERAGGTAGRRAGTLRASLVALDAELGRAKLSDARATAQLLGDALSRASPTAVARAVGAPRLAARWIVEWSASDVAWWRALDLALTRTGGGARIELPTFDQALDPGRERDVLEIVADDVARALDGAPEPMRVDAALGDLRGAGEVPSVVRARVTLRHAADAEAQARAVVDAVRDALERGAAVEEIAVAVPRIDDESLGPLRRALEEAGIVAHDPRGDSPGASGIVASALDALALASRGLPRADVAALLRSRYVDPRRVAGEEDRARAVASSLDLARALEQTPTASAPDPASALAATARIAAPARGASSASNADARAALAGRVASILTRASSAGTRAEHVAAARAVWSDLGLDPSRGRGARDTLASDAPASGIARAELRGMARDGHAWELLLAALDAYEASAVRLGVAHAKVEGAVFRDEIAGALEASASPPGGARAGAVRIARLPELSGERLALLVVLDANDGVLPGAGAGDALLSDALTTALRTLDPGAAPTAPAVQSARELAGLALAACHAQRVVLAYRARDEQGALLAPAPIVAWLERGGVARTVWRASPLDGAPTTAAEVCLQALARDPSGAFALRPRAARLAQIERARESFFESSAAVADDVVGRLGPSDALGAVLAHDTGGADRPLAITSLESLARCAFQGYASQVLRARERHAVRELPDARESGTLVHEALAAAFKATEAMWAVRPRDADAIRARALDAVDALVRADDAGSVLRRLALARLREGVLAVIDWSLADEAWDFALAEQRFGDPDAASWPALRIDDGVTALALRGSIDRVDVGHHRAAVRAIDYKSSKAAVEAGMKNLGETVFQIALYARVAAAAKVARELDGLYVPTQKRDVAAMRTRDAFAALWAELHEPDGGRARIEGRALAIVRGVREGALHPRPSDPRACDHCALSGGCRKPRFAITLADDDPPTPAD
jgi:ATP-dependent helicase/nuclease subunit B